MADTKLLRRHTTVNLNSGEYAYTNGHSRQCKTCRVWRHTKMFPDNGNRCQLCIDKLKLPENENTQHGSMPSLIRSKVRSALQRIFKDNRQMGPSDITVMYMMNVYYEQKGLCALTGRIMTLGIDKGKADKNALSLDRIDSNYPYVKGNVQFVTYQANVAKNRFTQEEFYSMCLDVVKRKLSPSENYKGESLVQLLEREGLPIPDSLQD